MANGAKQSLTRQSSKKSNSTTKKNASGAGKAAKKSPAAAKRNGFHPGTYIVPRGHVSIAVPTFWSLRQTNEDLQVESEASETTVIVTAYQRNAGVQALDAREYMAHFLETAPLAGRPQMLDGSKLRASARFRDPEGDNWLVRFITNGQTLLLATCHSNRPLNSREGRTGVAVLESIKLKARG
jgi:hypothetical protein